MVSFDMDGTLTDISFADSVWLEGMPHEYALRKSIPFEVAKKKVISEYNKIGKDRLEWYNLSYWIEKLGLDLTPKEILTRYESRIKVFPEVAEVLKELTDEEFRLIIITNAHRDFADLELETADITSHFEGIFSTTSDLGLVKNTVDAYRKVCGICKISPEQVIHVGDDECFDFDVPRKLGITAFHLDRTGEHTGEFVVRNLKELNERVLDL